MNRFEEIDWIDRSIDREDRFLRVFFLYVCVCVLGQLTGGSGGGWAV